MIELNEIKIAGAQIIEHTSDSMQLKYKEDLFVIKKYGDHLVIYIERILKNCTTLLFSILNEYNTTDLEATYTFDINTSIFRTRQLYYKDDPVQDLLDELIKKTEMVIKKYVAAVVNPASNQAYY